MVNDKKIEGISNANDESDREGMRIVVDVKRDANANVVLNKLFKMTPLQTVGERASQVVVSEGLHL